MTNLLKELDDKIYEAEGEVMLAAFHGFSGEIEGAKLAALYDQRDALTLQDQTNDR